MLWHDGRIDFAYASMNGGLNSCTVGLKARILTQSIQLAYNQPFVTSNSLVRFTPAAPAEQVYAEIRNFKYGIIPSGGMQSVPIRIHNRSLDFGELSCDLAVMSSDPAVDGIPLAWTVQSAPDSVDARLIIRATPSTITLAWRRMSAPLYCVYAGAPGDSTLNEFVAVVPDTFYTMPFGPENQRAFVVKMCDAPPLAGPTAPARQLTHDLR